MNLENLKTRLDYQTLLLAGFCLLASALLGLGNLSTSDTINLRKQEDLKASLEEVVPPELYDNEILADISIIDSNNDKLGAAETQVYIARKDNKVTAAAFMLVSPDGYSGDINLIMGIDRAGNVLGVRIISHNETPGLGDKIEIAKNPWVLSFNGHSLQDLEVKEWAVKKDGGIFDQFSGATITPRAVVRAVFHGLVFFQKHRAEIVGAID